MKAHLLLSLLLPLSLGAAIAEPEDTRPARTTLVMGLDIANGIVAPGAPSRVRVPPLEHVDLQVPADFPYKIQWTKDGREIPGATEPVFTILNASAGDSGLYSLAGLPYPHVATGIRLDVVPTGNVANYSARLDLVGAKPQIVGFSVSGQRPKNLLFRVAGPSLAAFGVENPAADPRIRAYDARGNPIDFVHAAVVYDWSAFFTSVGAFPLAGGESFGLAFNFGQFAPGAYTLHVHDAAGEGGHVLVEVYEFEQGPQPLLVQPAK